MLKISFIILILFSVNTYACWLGTGKLSLDGEAWSIHQKFETKKDYIIAAGPFLLGLRLEEKEKKINLIYSIQEKQGTKLITISEGKEEEIESGRAKEIFAKGLPGKANSIISLTFKNI